MTDEATITAATAMFEAPPAAASEAGTAGSTTEQSALVVTSKVPVFDVEGGMSYQDQLFTLPHFIIVSFVASPVLAALYATQLYSPEADLVTAAPEYEAVSLVVDYDVHVPHLSVRTPAPSAENTARSLWTVVALGLYAMVSVAAAGTLFISYLNLDIVAS